MEVITAVMGAITFAAALTAAIIAVVIYGVVMKRLGRAVALNEVSKRASVEIEATKDVEIMRAVFRTAYGEQP
jgi:hypothetical protein